MNKVIYYSRGGNTEKLATAIAKGANTQSTSLAEILGDFNADILFVGASIYAGKINSDLRAFLKNLKNEQVKAVVVFGTAAGKNTPLKEITNILKPNNIVISGREFKCPGSFLFVNRNRPNDSDLKNAEDFAKEMCEILKV